MSGHGPLIAACEATGETQATEEVVGPRWGRNAGARATRTDTRAMAAMSTLILETIRTGEARVTSIAATPGTGLYRRRVAAEIGTPKTHTAAAVVVLMGAAGTATIRTATRAPTLGISRLRPTYSFSYCRK
jgi:hypothetical protein